MIIQKCNSQCLTTLLLTMLILVIGTGCESDGQTGALFGAGIGALAGQAIGENTESTLIGAAIGGGTGYVIGNERDKRRAEQINLNKRANPGENSQSSIIHNETGQLAGTRWIVVSLAPKNIVPKYLSKLVAFDENGQVITTTTFSDGSVENASENYRVLGKTLIINKPGYIINATYLISGNQMIVEAEEFRAVLKSINP